MDEIDFPWETASGRLGTNRFTDAETRRLAEIMREHPELRPPKGQNRPKGLTAKQKWDRVRSLEPEFKDWNDLRLKHLWQRSIKPQLEAEEREKNKGAWNIFRRK